MKYLSSYKVFESQNKDLSNNIEDILIDLKDDGCVIDVKYYPAYGNTAFLRGEEDFRYSYNILISNNQMSGDRYDVDVIEPKIDQLHSYMRSEGYPHMRRDRTGSQHIFLFFAKDSYSDNSIKEAKKLDPETNFKGIIDDVLTDARDRGFQYYINSDKTTHIIHITYRSKTEMIKYPLQDPSPKTIFEWREIKDDIVMMINYLSDIYPKISFNDFHASLKFRKGSSVKRGYHSVRSALKSTERGIRSYSLKDFMSKLEDDDILENIHIQCLARFRGKI